MNAGVQRIFLLKVSGVLQQDGREFNRCWICEDRSAIARFRQHRQPSSVVQVRVSENEIVDRLRVNRQGLVVAVLEFLRTLKNSAIY